MRVRTETLHEILLALILLVIVKEVLAASMTVTLTIASPNPVVGDMIVFESPVILTENSRTVVWCNATANDSNGWQDIVSAAGVIWETSNSTYGSSNNYNNHYTNSSCHLGSGSGISRGVSCAFGVYYFARPGNWSCRITVEDSISQEGYNETNFNITAFLGLTTSSQINFGSMNPGTTSNTSVMTYVNNTCNQEIDILLNTLSHITCTIGTINSGYVRYNSTDMNYTSMCNLSISSDATCNEIKNNFNLQKCTTISGTPINPAKNIYWKIEVPYGVSGTCSTTLLVTAKES